MASRHGRLVASVALLAAALAGCAADPAAASGPIVPSVPGALPRPDHVVVVVFENKDDEQVVGSPHAPYLTQLAREGANLTDAHGETHPSQPNYLALLSGSTQGVADDACPQDLGASPTLASQLIGAGRSFAGYSEGLPAAGFTGCRSPDGRYARKHAPWVDFTSAPPSVNVPLSALPADDAALPTVAVVIPDMCHDMHDCPVPTGDAWARDHLQAYVQWARTHDSLLVVTFDEDDGSSQNHIATMLVGPMVRAGDVPVRADHYTLLRTLEDMYGLPPLGAAAHTAPLTGIWR
ncbi:acid phosphatase [Actinomycetospora sp. TBRC 11914]|nr:acid phosphatase [Actinomycetospora sp. TBRC 11914]